MKRATLLSAVAALLAIASRADAAELWVDASAAAGGDGSTARPFQKINDAKSALRTGDTMWIKDGTYQETVDFWHVPAGAGGRIYVRAAPGAAPVIDGGGASFVLQAGETPQMTFQGLTLRNGDTGVNFYQADEGQVIDCTTVGTGGSVSFHFASKGYVSGSKLEGSVSGKASDGTVIENNEIYGSGAEGITLHADSKNCVFYHNVVHDNTSVNIYLDSISNTVVESNLVYMTLPTTKTTVGIMLADESYPNVTSPKLDAITVINNVVVDNESGIRFWDGSFPGQSGLRNVVIANNTVVNNQTTAIKWDSGAHQGTTVQNNIFAGQSGKQLLLLQANSMTGVTLDHNLWFLPGVGEPMLWGSSTYDVAAWASTTGQGAGDVTGDPMLVGWDLPASNLALRAGSPAIDRGVALAQVTRDFDGASRPAGAGVDIGAFERGAIAKEGGADATGPWGAGGAPPSGSGGSGPVATTGGAAGQAVAPAAPPEGESAGCGCRLGGRGAHAAAWALLLLAACVARRCL